MLLSLLSDKKVVLRDLRLQEMLLSFVPGPILSWIFRTSACVLLPFVCGDGEAKLVLCFCTLTSPKRNASLKTCYNEHCLRLQSQSTLDEKLSWMVIWTQKSDFLHRQKCLCNFELYFKQLCCCLKQLHRCFVCFFFQLIRNVCKYLFAFFFLPFLSCRSSLDLNIKHWWMVRLSFIFTTKEE